MSVKKILLIDDEEYFCRVFKKSIAMEKDIEVLTTMRGEDGLLLAKSQKPDLILLDIMMPGMAGTAVAEELLQDPSTSSIPIIYVTAIVKQEEVQRNRGMFGGRIFFAKPVIMDDLIKRINAILSLG